MTFCETPQGLADDTDVEMARILKEMIDENETITARAVARKHPSIKHASSITRSPSRSELLTRYQEQQKQFRSWQEQLPKRSREQVAAQLAQKDSRIADLERQVEILRVFDLAMIRTVGELGGIGKLLKLYEGCQATRRELRKLGVLPQAEVTPIMLAQHASSKD